MLRIRLLVTILRIATKTLPCLAAAAAILLPPALARADSTLPPIQYQSDLGLVPGTNPTFTVSGGFGVTAIDCQPTVDCARATLTPDSASMFEFGFANESTDVQASVSYFWEITGPLQNVPISITYNNQWDAEGIDTATSWNVNANLSESTNRGSIGDAVFCGSLFAPNCTPKTASGTVSSVFTTNTVYELTLTVSGYIVSDPNGGAYLSATADPVISFSPGFDSTGYSIILSDGELNGAPPVPEPSTTVLIGLGLACVLGVIGKCRNRVFNGSELA